MPDDRLQELADRLAAAGVRHAFGVTGSGASLSLIAALAARGVRYLPVSHEAAGAMMAGATTAVGGRPAVSISIKGPGLANALPGIAANAFENRPAVSVAEAFGPAVPSYRKHKRLDHAGLLALVVKGSLTLDRLAALPALLDLAAGEAPGPVHLELCDGDHDADRLPESGGSAARATPIDSSAFDEAVNAIRSAAKPIVVAGSLAVRRGYGPLLESLGLPVFTTAAAKGLVDESLPHAAGVFTGDGKALAPESSLPAEADLVIGVGLRNTELLSPKPFGRRTILLDEIDADMSDGLGGELVLADAAGTRHVLEQLPGKAWGADLVAAAVRRMRDALLADGWSAPAAIELLNARPPGTTLVTDTGSFCTVAEHLWRAGGRREYLGSSNGRYMGTSIPTAVGAAVATPGRPVVCLVGDGGVRMHVAEIRLAVAERLPVCFVLMSDGRFGSVAAAAGPLGAAVPRAVGVDGASWWRAVEAMGCDACRAEDASAFEAALAAWAGDRPLFVEAPFEPAAYAAMTRELR